MSTYILGISCYYHDSSATLIKDGIVIAAVEEERFTRKKHDTRFPIHAIKYCLETAGIDINDILYVTFYEKPLLKLERVLSQHLSAFPGSYKTFVSSLPSWMTEKLRIIPTLRKKLGYKGDVLFVPHHIAHAASAFLPSPFDNAAIVTIDGVGEWSTTAIGMGNNTEVRLLKDIHFPHSLGLLYSTITAYLGFSVNNSEYKVMGLAAYGNTNRATNRHYEALKRVIDRKPDGSFRLDMNYFVFHYKDRMPSRKLCTLLGGPIRDGSDEITSRHKDIAAAVQLLTEDIVLDILSYAQKITGSKNVVLAGGVALNSVCNGKIISGTPFEHVWIQPNASDGGTSLGAALFAYHSLLGNKRLAPRHHAYFGPSYSDKEIESFLQSQHISYTKVSSPEELVRQSAKLITNNNVVGWFQGGMEWGPRALGARSILANPQNPDAQRLLNEKVKHRELFRPFAPVVCADDAPKYFDMDIPVPEPTDFMLMVYPIRREWQSKIPAVTHVDGSGRLQTIHRSQNALYFDLIKAVGAQSGIPILINTSFNIRGEPIVCTPHDAYRCMMGTGIDYLVMGSYIIKRADNLKDEWDSELLAHD